MDSCVEDGQLRPRLELSQDWECLGRKLLFLLAAELGFIAELLSTW